MNAVSQVQIASVRPALPVRRARASAARAVAGARRSAVSVKAEMKTASVAVSATAAAIFAEAMAAPAVQAAQEFVQVAEGEPLIVQLGWGSLCAMFSFSLAMVVWGRSGL